MMLSMRSVFLLIMHLLALAARLVKTGGVRSVIAENLLLRQQLIVLGRTRNKAPNLKTSDRFILGGLSLFISAHRRLMTAVIVRPSTLLRFHRALEDRKYSRLFSNSFLQKGNKRPGPKGPSQDLINAVVELKRRNPRFGCPRIAHTISITFGVEINKDIVRRILARHYKPKSGNTQGPSWLSLLGHSKDSLWSVDLFRCESLTLKSHWVLVIMDQWSRRIIGFGIHTGDVDGITVCRMFNQAISGKSSLFPTPQRPTRSSNGSSAPSGVSSLITPLSGVRSTWQENSMTSGSTTTTIELTRRFQGNRQKYSAS